MALYAAIGAEFKSDILAELTTILDERIKSVINRTLKQVAHDYELDYKVLKARYCSKESLGEYELPGQTQLVTVDLEPEAEAEPEITPEPAPAPAPKKVATKAPKAKASVAVMALSKMKKGDLVRECEERGLDSEGTVSQLKERVKEARDKEEPVPKPKEKKKAPAPSKEKAPAKEKKKEKKEVAPAPPPPPPVALEEDADEDICPRTEDAEDAEDEEWEEADTGASLQDRLRKILAEAGEEEEEYDEED
jgi:hypothetical protein